MNGPPLRIASALGVALSLFVAAVWMGSVAWRETELLSVYRATRTLTNLKPLVVGEAQKGVQTAAPYVDSYPEAARASYILNTWLWENFSRANRPEAPKYAAAALADQVRLLRESPSDPLGWYAFARLRSETTDMDDNALDALRLSYALGPSEGWISIIRLRFIFLIWDLMPADIQHLVEVELDSLFRDIHMYKPLADMIVETRPFGPEVMARIAERYRPEYAQAVRDIAARPD